MVYALRPRLDIAVASPVSKSLYSMLVIRAELDSYGAINNVELVCNLNGLEWLMPADLNDALLVCSPWDAERASLCNLSPGISSSIFSHI